MAEEKVTPRWNTLVGYLLEAGIFIFSADLPLCPCKEREREREREREKKASFC
jgi:hypothetical protein